MKTFIFFLFISSTIGAQNLVSNPSFEDTVPCQTFFPSLQCKYWYQAIGSPDLLTEFIPTLCGAAPLPHSPMGYQTPRSGLNCAGFAPTGYPVFIGLNECISGKLNSPLLFNHLYYNSFYINAANFAYTYVDKIGAYFSVDSIDPMTPNPYSFTPQVENIAGNIISDTTNWTLISGYFIAQGGERWITIGNFRPESQLQLDSNILGTEMYAYYFLDDVSVIDCTAVGIQEIQQVNFLLSPNPCNSYVEINAEAAVDEFSVYNLMMEQLKEESVRSELNFRVDVADLPKGIYFLKVETRDKRIGYKKFIKM